MFDSSFEKRDEIKNKIKYKKPLGWKEWDEDGNSGDVAITVLDTFCGYGVFRHGAGSCKLLTWYDDLYEAVEWAVDRARNEIAEHEIKQVEKLPKDK